jgi:SET domain-containing protein
VFAAATISVGDAILEYKGEIISAKEAQRRYERSTAGDDIPSSSGSTTDA